MNLDELKDLEAKATKCTLKKKDWMRGKWSNIVVYSFLADRPVVCLQTDYERGSGVAIHDMDAIDVQLACALRNSAKEMISTIERYKAALEDANSRLHQLGDGIGTISANDDESASIFSEWGSIVDTAVSEIDEALKDPEKTGAAKDEPGDGGVKND